MNIRVEVIFAIRDARGLTAKEKSFLYAVESRGTMFRTAEDAADDIGVPRATYYEVRKALARKGLLQITERARSTTEYRVAAQAVMALLPATPTTSVDAASDCPTPSGAQTSSAIQTPPSEGQTAGSGGQTPTSKRRTPASDMANDSVRDAAEEGEPEARTRKGNTTATTIGTPTRATSEAQSQRPGTSASMVTHLFEMWRISLGPRGEGHKLTASRRKAIEKALGSYPGEDVADALIGWRWDPWPERRLHNEPQQLLRDGNLEKFRDLERGALKGAVNDLHVNGRPDERDAQNAALARAAGFPVMAVINSK